MIGIKFLFTFIQVAAYVAIAALIVLVFFFVVTWAFRLLFTGFKVGLSDHWSWFRGLLPRRKKEPEFTGWYDVLDPKDNVTVVCQTRNPTFFIEKGYIVKEVYHES